MLKMTEVQRTYIAIDLKSFYASVECVERGLDPLDTHLVVADASRTSKTICLAVTPSLKAHGISGRARLFEVEQRVREVNAERQRAASPYALQEKSYRDSLLKQNPYLRLDYIVAPPRMALYIQYSQRIYEVYLKYVAPEDIHVYSIDEVFMDVTNYLPTYKLTAHELATRIMHDVLQVTHITSTAGIGTNLYLCKVAMDILAKHAAPDERGVRIAELDEMSYRRLLWDHRPLTDFWRIGRGIARRLQSIGIDTMGKLAWQSHHNEEVLYKMFGVNAELIIDHAWGWEPCTMEYIKAYRPESHSQSSGQVLNSPYTFAKARVVVHEMIDGVALDLLDKGLMTDQLVLTIGYDTESLKDAKISQAYKGPIHIDHYGRSVPKHAQGTRTLPAHTRSNRQLSEAVLELYDSIVNPILLIRRINIAINHVITEEQAQQIAKAPVQLNLFTDYQSIWQAKEREREFLAKEQRMQEAVLNIKKQFGKNALLKGLNFADGATARERNAQIGGHKA